MRNIIVVSLNMATFAKILLPWKCIDLEGAEPVESYGCTRRLLLVSAENNVIN